MAVDLMDFATKGDTTPIESLGVLFEDGASWNSGIGGGIAV